MNCREYIESYLSAHADGELAPSEVEAAEEHLAACAACCGRLNAERALKSAISQHAGFATIPAEVKARISDTLDLEDRERAPAGAAAASAKKRNVAVRAARNSQFRRRNRMPILASIAAVAAAVMIFVAVRHRQLIESGASNRVTVFDMTIDKYQSFAQRFTPTVDGSYANVAEAYHAAGMPDLLFRFDSAGIPLMGGRLDRLPDGRRVTYTFYQGQSAAVLCSRFEDRGMSAPPGAVVTRGNSRFYTYRGYSICLTYIPNGDFICILVTRTPLKRFMHEVLFPQR